MLSPRFLAEREPELHRWLRKLPGAEEGTNELPTILCQLKGPAWRIQPKRFTLSEFVPTSGSWALVMYYQGTENPAGHAFTHQDI